MTDLEPHVVTMSNNRQTRPLTPAAKIGIVGAGAFGRFCIDAYRRAGDISVEAIADPDPAVRSLLDGSDLRLEKHWEALIAMPNIEVLHIATPPFLRNEVVLAAFAAKKSVFCEKPLALSLEEADEMIAAAEANGMAIGIDYVMRHQPAYRLLERLAGSGLFGHLRSFSLQNFAQSVPLGHWFWDRTRSGGIFVEHGVHFFDAYGRIAGSPLRVWGSMPRREAVEATVEYETDVVGRFYHEFGFPQEVERTLGISFFERGYIEIEGWIPTRLSAAVDAPAETLMSVVGELDVLGLIQEGHVTRFHLEFPHREASYQAGVVSGMREIVRRHRDPGYAMTVTIADARASLALGLACQESAATRQIISLLPVGHR